MIANNHRPKLGRNDPCPTCGRKMKKCPGHGRKIPPWVLVRLALSLPVLLVLVGLTLFSSLSWRPPPAPSWEERVAASVQLIQGFANRKPPDRWWLETMPDLASSESQLALMATTDAVQAKIHRLLGQYRSVSALAGEIATVFPQSWVSIYNRGITQALVRGDPTQPFSPSPEAIEICFIPHDQRSHGRHPSHFYYHAAFRGLMLSALEFPDRVMAGLLFHELGHALRHRQGAASATAPSDSEAYAQEEVEMHALEADVFNAVSAGRYYALLDAVVDRPPLAADEREAIVKLTASDLAALDEALGASGCGTAVANALTAQYAFSVGLRYVQRNCPEAERPTRSVQLYRWFARSH